MKNICRILSLIVACICFVIGAIIIVKVMDKPKSKTIYATDISFATSSGGVVMFVDNELIVSKTMINISPANCEVEPEFEIKKHGDAEIFKISDSYVFGSAGKYTLSCKIRGGKDYYLDDKITITVVDVPDEGMDICIKELEFDPLFIGDCVRLNTMFEIFPETEIRVVTSEHLKYEDGNVYAKNYGSAWIKVFVTNEKFTVAQKISLNILQKPESSESLLRLTLGSTILESNQVEIGYSEFNIPLNYQLLGMNNQYINCWTEGDVLEVDEYNPPPPTIFIKPLKRGTAIVYVSPVEHPTIVLEIVITII